MATKRIKDLTTKASSLQPTDMLPISVVSPDVDRKVTIAALMSGLGIAAFAFASLPSAATADLLIYVTDGRKVGEGAAAGTGVVCRSDGADWKTVDDGSTVAN